MRDVVAIPHVGELNVLHVAKSFLQGEIVGESLAGMLQIAQRVDDRNVRVLGHVFHRVVRESTQHDDVHPALQIARYIAELLASAERTLGLIHEERNPTQARHPSFKRK